MNNDNGIILGMQEDGTWGIKEEPYCTMEVATKEDYEELQEMLEKQIPRKPITIYDHVDDMNKPCCPRCELSPRVYRGEKYCTECGGKIDWRVEE